MYTFSSRVRYSECDQDSRLTLIGLIDYFQDASVFHTQTTSRPMEALRADGLAWMIACWNIRINKLPKLGDEISISTWSYNTKGIMAERCYQITDPAGEAYAQADTKWFLYDFAAASPIRISPEEYSAYQSDEARLDLPPTKRKLKLEGEPVLASEIHVTEQLLDTNHHVNNAQYIELARAAADLSSETISGVQVEYCAQATLGDLIVPKIFKSPEWVGVVLSSASDEPFAQVKFEFRA